MTDPLRVVWYTDPHNIWCWGCEPTIRRLEVVYAGQVELEIRQGGLFEDFSPVREQWARMSGGRWNESIRAFFEAVANQHRMPMDSSGMVDSSDDFNSTWPACIAAKAAALQGAQSGGRYLRALREAWVLDGRPIHRVDVQTAIADEGGLDVTKFTTALEDGSALDSFRKDREEAERLEVQGFPTFLIERGNASARLNGWQPWEVFDDVLRQVDPTLDGATIEHSKDGVLSLLERPRRWATREIAAVLGITDDDAELLLEELEGTGKLRSRPVGNGLVWERVPLLSATP
jgi:predicted DsbA family dithiol-disulfide isomerase